MSECEYCHEPYKPVRKIFNINLWETDNRVYVQLRNSSGITKDFFEINYCPMCGRKLVPDAKED